MTNLTDKWRKGELPDGVYYCDTGNTVETLFTWGKNYHQLTNNKDEVYIPEMDDCEVLAPVPSYEEWKQLKELLKECKHIMSIEKDFASCHFEKDKLCKLLTQINQVLGEE